MKQITEKDHKEFIKTHKEITIGKTKIKIGQPRARWMNYNFETVVAGFWAVERPHGAAR